ncbi:hypothetical protein SCB49_06197 [unidentified eubacterium SCB49]|nr:hypothetical protein SCB49_06197 [unidentified eubacterium SCB49]
MQRLHFQALIIVLIVFTSCGNENNNTIQASQTDTQKEIIFGKNNHTAAVTAPPVIEITNNWGGYLDFSEDITKVNRNTIEGLKVVSDRLAVTTDSLYRFIPDTLNTTPIASRLLVVQTRIKLLQQQLGFDRIDSTKIEEHISEINDAHTVFISQMNEKFIKDGINQEQKEVEDREIEQRKQDSIFKLELQDNNRN